MRQLQSLAAVIASIALCSVIFLASGNWAEIGAAAAAMIFGFMLRDLMR